MMRRLARIAASIVLGAVLAAVLAAVVPGGAGPASPQAAVAAGEADRGTIDWSMRGFTYSSWWHDEYLRPESGATMDRIAATGANWVAINPTQYMADWRASAIYPDHNGRTASDEAIIRAVADAHARGMKVMLKPHVDSQDDVWRGEIVPADRAAWFASYRQFIEHYAALAEEHGVELLVIGTELASMSGSENHAEWERVVSGVRARYGGKITYSASLNEYGYACMWGMVDYLGFNFYFPLSDDPDPTVEEIMAGWSDYNGYYGPANWLDRIRSWQARWDKPVIFTEIGYRSIIGTVHTPWDFWTPGEYNGYTQARAYEAAFRVLANEPYVIGAFWWNWTAGDIYRDPQNTEYSIAGKPAEGVLSDWYTNRVNTGPQIQMDLGAVVWESYASYRDRELSVFFDVRNSGNETARGVQVIAGSASNQVMPVSTAVQYMGDITAGDSMPVKIVYSVPYGTASFRVGNYAACQDEGGEPHYFPVAPPGY